MSKDKQLPSVIIGCGDIGRRVAARLIDDGLPVNDISAYVNTQTSYSEAQKIGIDCQIIDLDSTVSDVGNCENANVYYTVAPQKHGVADSRTKALLNAFSAAAIKPNKVVLISTTGVYGDYDGEWVNELSPTCPQTERGKRRLDSEQQWQSWGVTQNVPIVVLRVPGIYSLSRLPRARIEKQVPVVSAQECGFTNRIHADDLATMCVQAMRKVECAEVYNATDGTPGKITEYLQAAAKSLGLAPLPEISMAQAQTELSAGMLSYLGESRKISNKKILDDLEVELQYPDFKNGLLN